MTRVAIVATGTANLASVMAAMRRLDATPVLATTARALRDVDHVILPGVGAFGAAAATLAASGLDEAVCEHVRAAKPLLAICLGLQLLAEGSTESPGSRGLGVLHGTATRLPESVRVPQLGWNRVDGSDGLVTRGYAYFANSYALREPPPGWCCAMTVHGEPFVAALQRGPQLACQFHPELSGTYGAELLRRWWLTC